MPLQSRAIKSRSYSVVQPWYHRVVEPHYFSAVVWDAMQPKPLCQTRLPRLGSTPNATSRANLFFACSRLFGVHLESTRLTYQFELIIFVTASCFAR